jgi:hypothetical protein
MISLHLSSLKKKMFEYLDLPHLPFVDKDATPRWYCLLLKNNVPVFIDGYQVCLGHQVIGICQSFKPLALTVKYFPRASNSWGSSDICLLTNTRQEYRWHGKSHTWILLTESFDQDEYYVEEENNRYPQTLSLKDKMN